MEVIYERCCGLDVGKDEVVCCLRTPNGSGGRRSEIRTYSTFTSRLEQLAAWLKQEGVTHVVKEATGQYWKPIWYVTCALSSATRSRPRWHGPFSKHRSPDGLRRSAPMAQKRSTGPRSPR